LTNFARDSFRASISARNFRATTCGSAGDAFAHALSSSADNSASADS
jgi:hypothetical protein